MPNKNYPEALELAWRLHARHATGAREDKTAIARLEPSAGLLSDTFTTGREPDFSGYRNNKKALAAYGLFFFPRTYVRTRHVLEECVADRPPAAPRLHIVDLGAGTGGAGFAALETLSSWYPEARLQLDMVDCASEGIDLSRTIFSAGHAMWPLASVREIKADATTYTPPSPVDVILSSFAINEWMEGRDPGALVAWVERQMRSLRPGGWLVLLEPALRTAVERMERLRDEVAAAGMARILAPCPHQKPCPILAQKKGWCHEVQSWRVPASLRQINQKLQRDVHLLKYSFLVLQKAPAAESNWMRLVSPVRKEKGKYVCHGCGADGHLHACEWLTRNQTSEQEEASEALSRGDRVAMPVGTLLPDGVRLRLDGPPQA